MRKSLKMPHIHHVRDVVPSFVAAALAVSLLAGPAKAAPDPSVSDIIRALTLSPNKTRGSRPVVQEPTAGPLPAPSAAPAQTTATARPIAAPPVPPPAAVAGSGAIDLSVQFASGSAELTASARKTLDLLGQALKSPELASTRVRIEGHTDTVGTHETNMSLSQRRATAAVAYLVERFAIQSARLEAVGRGEENLLISTGSNVDEPRNRRVHVVALDQ
jgi:outer membrane protein OmpA-like peptidoglycan-associated protein